MGQRDQPQPGVRRREAPQPRPWIVVFVADTNREMQRGEIVVDTGAPQDGFPTDPLPDGDVDARQIRVGGPQTVAVRHRHAQHLGDTSGKSDPASIGCAERAADRSGDVDSPMPTVLADGSEVSDYVAREWRCKPGTGTDRNQQRKEKRQDGGRGCDRITLPATAAGTT
jgi:hypothetical protein